MYLLFYDPNQEQPTVIIGHPISPVFAITYGNGCTDREHTIPNEILLPEVMEECVLYRLSGIPSDDLVEILSEMESPGRILTRFSALEIYKIKEIVDIVKPNLLITPDEMTFFEAFEARSSVPAYTEDTNLVDFLKEVSL